MAGGQVRRDDSVIHLLDGAEVRRGGRPGEGRYGIEGGVKEEVVVLECGGGSGGAGALVGGDTFFLGWVGEG